MFYFLPVMILISRFHCGTYIAGLTKLIAGLTRLIVDLTACMFDQGFYLLQGSDNVFNRSNTVKTAPTGESHDLYGGHMTFVVVVGL